MPDVYDGAIEKIKTINAKLAADPVIGAAYTAASIPDKIAVVREVLRIVEGK